ncbi:conserved hypothetical protein [Echinococcus multilocularis]|uniref:Uncharacterized protein n=1 Tax=Echinococcus multilocularis TaxID=6211 RepID=A0A068XY01_ECHMU|nr:conserved hypothetical protein [Echinococcus multilocularis]
MSREVSKPIRINNPASESFYDDDDIAAAQNPLCLVQNISESPDVTQKKLMSEIRKLTLKVSELENFCDDCESEKQELLQTKFEHEREISALEEKCRIKERELVELRDACNELHICQIDNEKLKAELERLIAALKSSQEINEAVEVLKRENDELTKENTMFDNKIKLLESEVAEWKTNSEWKKQYEQVKDALEKAEKELFEFVKESEHTKTVSEVELMRSRWNHSRPVQWATISCLRCTCTCHHRAFQFSQIGEDSRPPYGPSDGVGDFCSTSSPSSQPPESTQNMGEISVVDVSLWRDTRSSLTQSDATGECLGEIMAQDTKVQDLQTQLNVARNEVDRLNVELSRISTQHNTLSNKYKSELESLEARICDLNLEKETILTDLKAKCLTLETVNDEVSILSSQLKTTSSELTAVKAEANHLKNELDRTLHKLDESEMDKLGLSNKLNYFECELAQFLEKEKEFKEVKLGLEKQLNVAQAEIRSLRSENKQTAAALENKLDDLMRQLSETQNQLKSNEILRTELSDHLDSLQKEGKRLGEDKVILSEQLALSKKAADDFSVRLQEAITDLGEKASLVEHLKLERVKLIETSDTAHEELSKVKSELSRAQEEVARLSNELNDNDDAGIRVEQLESSLRTRDSNIASLNQLICENDAVISRLTEEKSRLEEIARALKVDLEAQTSTCNLLIEERDKALNDCDKRTQEITDEKKRFLRHMKALESDLVKHTRVNKELSEKCASTKQDLSNLQQKLSLIQDEAVRLSETNQRLIDDNAKLAEEKVNLKQLLEEESSLIANLRNENGALTMEISKLKLDAEKYQQEIVETYGEKSIMTEKLESRTIESMNLETQLTDLRNQLALVTADQERLLGSNTELSATVAVMEADRSHLESQLGEMRRKYAEAMAVGAQHEEANHLLEENVKRLRTDFLAAEQRMAEARQSASVAALHRQFAENECSRLLKFIKGLELRLDSATTERLACEERVVAEVVRCRQLEGSLNEKDTVISALRHQLNQLDAQWKSAQEMEASTLTKYLKSRTAHNEAEKRLALLESSSSIIWDKKRNFGSSDHISRNPPNAEVVLTSMTVSEFPELPSLRRHSNGTTPHSLLKSRSHHEQPPGGLRSVADMVSSAGEKGNLHKPHFENGRKFRQSPPFGDVFLAPLQGVVRPQGVEPSSPESREVTFKSCSGEERSRMVEGESVPAPSFSPPLYFIHSKDFALCTPLFDQETDTLKDKSWLVVSPISPQEFEQSSSNNVVLTTKRPIHVAETVELPRCASAASNATNTDTDTVSELEGWPPYSNCAAPLSPQALRGNRIFTVPTPFEFHYRRLRRLLIAPAAEEMDAEAAASCLEAKSILGDDFSQHISNLAETPCPYMDEKPSTDSHIVAASSERQNQRNVKPVNVNTSTRITPVKTLTPETTIQIKDLSKIEDCNESDTPEGRQVGVDPAASRSTSASRPPAAKLARFQSVQELCDLDATPLSLRCSTSMNALDRAAAGRTQGVASSRPGFRRFKDKFGKVRGRKTTAEGTPVASSRPAYWSGKENAELDQLARIPSASSVKAKKHNKLRLSNVFKSKKNKP